MALPGIQIFYVWLFIDERNKKVAPFLWSEIFLPLKIKNAYKDTGKHKEMLDLSNSYDKKLII